MVRVRHYYLRNRPEIRADLSVALAEKGERKRSSHIIALDLRRKLAGLALPSGAAIKVVEAPPGPPVMATLLAEIYGPDAQTRRAVAERVKATFHSVPYIVDIDDSYGQPRPGLRLVPDRDRLEALKVSDRDVHDFSRRRSWRPGGRLLPSGRGPRSAGNLRTPSAVGPQAPGQGFGGDAGRSVAGPGRRSAGLARRGGHRIRRSRLAAHLPP